MLHEPFHAAANDVAIFLVLMGIAGAEIGQQGQARGGRVGVQRAQRGRIGGNALGQLMKAPVPIVELGAREVLQAVFDGRLGELSAGRIADASDHRARRRGGKAPSAHGTWPLTTTWPLPRPMPPCPIRRRRGFDPTARRLDRRGRRAPDGCGDGDADLRGDFRRLDLAGRTRADALAGGFPSPDAAKPRAGSNGLELPKPCDVPPGVGPPAHVRRSRQRVLRELPWDASRKPPTGRAARCRRRCRRPRAFPLDAARSAGSTAHGRGHVAAGERVVAGQHVAYASRCRPGSGTCRAAVPLPRRAGWQSAGRHRAYWSVHRDWMRPRRPRKAWRSRRFSRPREDPVPSRTGSAATWPPGWHWGRNRRLRFAMRSPAGPAPTAEADLC